MKMTQAHWLALLVVWALSVGYMATQLKRGWVPFDDGDFAQSAERVLHGELPHRDFDDVYSGGLAYLDALAFRELGVNLASLRIVLFVFFVAWVPCVFYIASRFASAAYAAAGVTLLAVAWSVPNYPAGVPSWYNLFFATFGTAALLRYLDVGSRRWLFLAGICGGLSILVKAPGFYFVGAVLLFLIFNEQSIPGNPNGHRRHDGRLYASTVATGLLTFLYLLFRLVHALPDPSWLICFFLPSLMIVVLLLVHEFVGFSRPSGERFATLLGSGAPFGAGVALPLLAFLVPYIRSGSTSALLLGVFVQPMRRFVFATQAPKSPLLMALAIPFILPIIFGFYSGKFGRLLSGGLLAVFLSAVLIFSAKSPTLYAFGWCSIATTIPLLIVAGVRMTGASRNENKIGSLRQRQLVLLLSVTALCSLVQIPFAAPIYYCYVLPLAILTAAALFASTVNPPRFILGALVVFYLLFAIMRVTPGFIYSMGFYYAPDTQTQRLTLDRAGDLRVAPDKAQMYEQLIPLIQSHSFGRFIYCTQDCPEVYFLAGLGNPTRTMFDFLDDPQGRTDRIMSLLETRKVNVVAINHSAGSQSRPDVVLEAALDRRFRHSTKVQTFEVRWDQ
jgi:hypothetical protein